MAATFTWGTREWGYGDEAAFRAYLAAHGVAYDTWADNHPDAAALLTTPPVVEKPEPAVGSQPAEPGPQIVETIAPPPPVEAPPAPVVEAPPPPPPTPQVMPKTFEWGTAADGTPLTWAAADLTAFAAYLGAHGVAYETWAGNHPDQVAAFGWPTTLSAPPSPPPAATEAAPADDGSRTLQSAAAAPLQLPAGAYFIDVGPASTPNPKLAAVANDKPTAQGGWASLLHELAHGLPNAGINAQDVAARLINAVA